MSTGRLRRSRGPREVFPKRGKRANLSVLMAIVESIAKVRPMEIVLDAR